MRAGTLVTAVAWLAGCSIVGARPVYRPAADGGVPTCDGTAPELDSIGGLAAGLVAVGAGSAATSACRTSPDGRACQRYGDARTVASAAAIVLLASASYGAYEFVRCDGLPFSRAGAGDDREVTRALVRAIRDDASRAAAGR